MKVKIFGYEISITKPRKYNLELTRRSGRTTRIADRLIQELFTTGKCEVSDHFGNGYKNRRRVFEILTKRLLVEHKLKANHYITIGLYKGIELPNFQKQSL